MEELELMFEDEAGVYLPKVVADENERKANEEERIANENQRKANEEERIVNEESRKASMEQFDAMKDELVASVKKISFMKESKVTYTTTKTNESTFKLPSEYTETSMVWVYVNGMKLNVNEYTIDITNSLVVLTSSLDVVGTVVEIQVFRLTTVAEEDYDLLKGEKGEKGENGENGRGNFIHISFDDVEYCTKNLINGNYTSLYDEPFFNWLKNLHETYGAKFSLYAYNISHLASIPVTYKDEFFEARDWLKFGLHSTTKAGTYGSSTYNEGQTDWNLLVEQVIRFAGSHESIDRIPRLNYFEGTKESLQGMRDCSCGALGFLGSDAIRQSYYLSEEQNTFLNTHDHLIDFENGLIFYKTDFRGDWFKTGFTSDYEYDVPTKANVYDELVYRLSVAKYGDTFKSHIWFCHEWQIYDGTTLNSYKVWVEDACRFSKDYNIPCDFPQNRIDINPTSYMFLKVSSSGGDTAERLATPTGLTISEKTLTWNTVDNASSYEICDGDTVLGTVTTNSYDLSSLDTTKEHTIYVQAISNSEDYTNSYRTSILYVVLKYGGVYKSGHLVENGYEILGVSDISQLSLEIGKGVTGGVSTTSINFKETVGRASSMTNVLYGNFDGKTLSLVKPTLSDGTQIYYTIWYGYTVDNVYQGSQYMIDDNNYTSEAWVTENLTLPVDKSNTNPRFLFISFKRGDGSIDFTTEELETLKTCLVISD